METIARPFECKEWDEKGNFSGYASVAGNIDSHGDIVAKGAFADTLAEANRENRPVQMLWQHGVEGAMPLGVWQNLREDDTGLYVEGQLALGTQRGRDVYELMKMGAITGMSIGYRATSWVMHGKHHRARRTLKAVKLFEVSLVSDPSNGLARVQRVKSHYDSTDRFSRALAELAAAVRA
jgi:HK97 family phage prohead protease